jgi:hypothetical protein
MNFRLLIPLIALLLAACDIPGMGPDPRIAQREADAKAAGSACRFALRGIEDCYELNEKASKAAIFAGWKEMDQYMRENKVEGIPYKQEAVEPPKKTAEPPEEIISDKKAMAGNDKPAAGVKAKAAEPKAPAKPGEKS